MGAVASPAGERERFTAPASEKSSSSPHSLVAFRRAKTFCTRIPLVQWSFESGSGSSGAQENSTLQRSRGTVGWWGGKQKSRQFLVGSSLHQSHYPLPHQFSLRRPRKPGLQPRGVVRR